MTEAQRLDRRLSSEMFVLIVMVSLAYYVPPLFGDEVPRTGSVLVFGLGWLVVRVATIAVGELWRRQRPGSRSLLGR
jgi:hypothetical protein